MLDNLTLAQLNAMTKEQIIAEIVAGKTLTERTKSETCKDGQTSQVYVTKDLAGAVIKTEQWGWSYDKSGVVEEITKTVYDSKSAVIEAVKIATVDGVLKAVPVDIKDIAPIDAKLP